jgi:hypothetical protein
MIARGPSGGTLKRAARRRQAAKAARRPRCPRTRPGGSSGWLGPPREGVPAEGAGRRANETNLEPCGRRLERRNGVPRRGGGVKKYRRGRRRQCAAVHLKKGVACVAGSTGVGGAAPWGARGPVSRFRERRGRGAREVGRAVGTGGTRGGCCTQHEAEHWRHREKALGRDLAGTERKQMRRRRTGRWRRG